MIGTSIPEYIWIRTCITVLHGITPLSLLSCAYVVLTKPYTSVLPLAIEAWLALETSFYIFIYIPRKRRLQQAASHPELVSREERQQLFHRCAANIPDPENYLSKWFMNSPISEIKRENLEEFLRWAFLSTQVINKADDEEIKEYVEATEKLLGRKLAPGRGSATSLRLTFDKVNMLHRSVFWYLVSIPIDHIHAFTNLCSVSSS